MTIIADHATVTGMADPVGVLEVAARLGVKDRTVHKWLQLGQMPAANYERINGSRAWEWRTILRWAGEKGRLRTADLVEEYRSAFSAEPAAERNAGRPLKVTPSQIEEIATSDTPAGVLAERFGVSEAYVWKVRRLRNGPRKRPVKKAVAKKAPRKTAAERKAAALRTVKPPRAPAKKKAPAAKR